MLVSNFLILTSLIYCESKFVSRDNTKSAENNATTKQINFVESIKQDLKRNNDDYNERSKSPVNLIIKNGYRRRNGGSYQEYEYEDTSKLAHVSTFHLKNNNKSTSPYTTRNAQKPNTHINKTRFDKRHNLIMPMLNRIPIRFKTDSTVKNFTITSFTKKFKFEISTNEIPKFIKKNKIEKYKSFLKKNKDLIKKYQINKNLKQTITPQQTPLTETPRRETRSDLPLPKLLRNEKKIPRIGDHSDGALPSPELLDMAPALGGRINKQRERGKLCHRHVLIPEGPKYDSKGRWYLPAHELIARRPYPATRRPEILLPRCCNCCKKSVLGCE